MRIFKFSNDCASRGRGTVLGLVLAGVAAMPLASRAEGVPAPTEGLAMYGEPALKPGFQSLPYVNPDAPKGGTIRLGEPGSFDSLKPWVLKGNPVQPLSFQPNLVVETLMMRSLDEAFTLYCLLCESVQTDDARSYVEFTLRPEARFSDGSPVTVEDVIWSLETLGTKGHPRYLGTWARVAKVESPGPGRVRLTFTAPDRELPLLMGMRPILKKAQWQGQDFSQSGLTPPIGSGPYVVGEVDPGRRITFQRNPDYWAKDLPITRGLNNFDTVRYDYFADSNAMFEAFKAGEIDVWREQNAARWARDFSFAAVTDGRVIKEEIAHQRPSGMIGLVMNTRNPIFADWRVREAMIDAFNFRFINNTLTGGEDARITSYFDNSPLAAGAGPATGAVLDLLKPFAADLPPGTLEGYALPEGSDRPLDRKAIRGGLKLLEEAGWTVQDGLLKNQDGKPFAFEIVLNQTGSAMRSSSEVQQMVSIYVEALRNLGMQVQVTTLDSAQYVERVNNYRFDMTWYERALSLSPGNEQTLYWGSEGVTEPGTRNLMGVASPAVDAVIAALLQARDDAGFKAAVQALDRVLTVGRYVIPVSFQRASRMAVSASLAHPKRLPVYGDWPGWMPDAWWQKPQ
ncbi:ABC transporter substrate-binding protein [Paracoccus suum]|uniref:ABC transporter substrate-binding protein n=1 Tax=Paracoccus suum TaxID=2259340 RepID=A0A344PP07_9RHOB|nr:extracellular solute-binding protein [Paracoccus suum]AXC51112.1 ABC transporter substrate-binding protein [Paracoccus suum]